MFNNFFKNIKEKKWGGTQAGFNMSKFTPGFMGPGVGAGLAYDLFKNSKKKNNYDTGVEHGPFQPVKPTYNSKKARDGYNDAVNDFNNYKARKAEDFSSLGAGLDDRRQTDEDGEDDGPSIMERYLAEIADIRAGNFSYSSTEQANLDNLKKTGRQAELRQSRVNENYMGGTLQGEQRSGRSRYAQEIADDAMINAMQRGTDEINRLDIETSKAVTGLEEDIKERRMRAIAEKYGLLQEQDSQRQSAYQDLQQNLLDYAKLQNDIMNDSRGSVENDYNLALSQGYTGSYRQFLKEIESNNLLGKYAPASSTGFYSGNTGGSSRTDDISGVTISG